ncbi:MAG TPA: tetratricopeptide repeat protein, partial [Gemmatimonadales bacterium]|nr:tetratricopeptide repeat protein [Gemmatimonadales bacterium]
RERHLATTAYYHRLGSDFDKAIAAHRAALDVYPDDAGILMALGVVYFEVWRYASAESTYAQALARDSTSYVAYLNLAEVQLLRGKRPEGTATFEHMVDAFPGNPEVAWWQAALASMSGDYEGAESHLETFRERSGRTYYSRMWAGQMAGSIAALEGHIGEAERQFGDAIAAALEDHDYRSYYEFATDLAEVHLRVVQQPQRALRDIDRILSAYPLDSLPPLDRPYLKIATLLALAGQPRRARELLAEYERNVAPEFRRMVEHMNTRHAVRGELALREGRVGDAVEEFRLGAAATRQCPICGLEALGRAYATAGQTDSAIAVYERYLDTQSLQRVHQDGSQLAIVLRQLGWLYDQRGESAKAGRAYRRFLKLWKDCDPELRSEVAKVSRRLHELEEIDGDRPIP